MVFCVPNIANLAYKGKERLEERAEEKQDSF